MNLNLDPSQEQLIRQLVQSILTPAQKGECRCHWLDASKIPILAWKSANNTFTLKIATQKLIGFARNDKHGAQYWKFRNEIEDSAKQDFVSAKHEEVLARRQNLSEAKEKLNRVDNTGKTVEQAPNPPPVEPKPEPKKESEWNEVESVKQLSDSEERKVQLELGDKQVSAEPDQVSETVQNFREKYGTADSPKREQ